MTALLGTPVVTNSTKDRIQHYHPGAQITTMTSTTVHCGSTYSKIPRREGLHSNNKTSRSSQYN